MEILVLWIASVIFSLFILKLLLGWLLGINEITSNQRRIIKLLETTVSQAGTGAPTQAGASHGGKHNQNQEFSFSE